MMLEADSTHIHVHIIWIPVKLRTQRRKMICRMQMVDAVPGVTHFLSRAPSTMLRSQSDASTEFRAQSETDGESSM
jgi:hypothetical protein